MLLLATATIQGQRLFNLELPIVLLLQEGSVYSKKYIQNISLYYRGRRANSIAVFIVIQIDHITQTLHYSNA